MAGRVLIGTSSWTDPTLVKDGTSTRPRRRSAEARLRFYATQFPLVEVDSTYYFPPSEKNSVLWIERTPTDFTFNVKAYSLLTNHPTRRTRSTRTSGELPPRCAQAEPLPRAAPRRGRRRGVAAVPRRADAAALGGQARGRAVPVPAVVRDRSRRAEDYILECAERLTDFRVAVEFRHKTWLERAQRRGDALVPGGARPAVRLRRHAAGVRFERAADRRGDREGPRDGAVPRPGPRGLEREERDRLGPLPLRVLGGRAAGVGAAGSASSRRRRARPTS